MVDYTCELSTHKQSGAPSGPYFRFFKRAFDVLIVLLYGCVILTTVMVLAALVKMDGGPAFYSQMRVGRGGRVFKMWKLRSMVVDADTVLRDLLERDPHARAEWEETQKLRHDPRVTPVGRWLRKLSLDELPQFWNVLKGDMSLVGPRPFMPEQMDLYPGDEYYYLLPGLTGFWQVEERNSTSFAARAMFDRQYYTEVSLKTDLRIIFSTFAVVMRGTGC
jgi:lipopolysaccharide/colanic/teichoic acid biosynthesis glycosyltransferase